MAAFLLDRFVLRVSGPDAQPFLQDLLTQNLDRLSAQRAVYAGLLTPQGKVSADMMVWATADGVVIECDPARGPDLLRKLSMYRLRRQVEVVEADALAVVASPTPLEDGAPDPRFPDGALGWRALRDRTNAPANDADAYEAMRFAAGAPDLARDAAADEVFALEALFEELNGVDFQKGCFVGQENVSRMKRRATTRKKFCTVVFAGDAPAQGTTIRAGEAEFGSVRTSLGARAFALLRLDRALEAVEKGVTLEAGGRALTLDPPAWLILPQEREA